jgi:polyribonucleotide nucleotidyltransferase
MCFISSVESEAIEQAKNTIEGILKEVEVGEEYDGEVVRMSNFGAFVEILPGKSGLVHVSKMSTDYVKDPGDVVKIGDTVHVRVVEIDDLGRINLSMLTKEEEQTARNSQRNNSKPRHNHDRKFQSRPKRRY